MNKQGELESKMLLLKKRVEELEALESTVIDICIGFYIPFNTSQPRESLNNLLRTNVAWAMDPQISKSAADFSLAEKNAVLDELREFVISEYPNGFLHSLNIFQQKLNEEPTLG